MEMYSIVLIKILRLKFCETIKTFNNIYLYDGVQAGK